MNIYHYTADTGIFYAKGVADESPLEPGVYLVPAHATTVSPPVVVEPEIAVFKDGAWSVEVLPPPPEPEPAPISEPPVELTPTEKLLRSGLTVAELKELLGLE
jgi:hypothetical protein